MMRRLNSKEAPAGGEATVKKAAVMPAILMAAVCYLAGWINTMMSLDVERAVIFIQQGRTEQLKAMLLGFVKVLAHDNVEQLLGVILIAVIIFLKRKSLENIKYKDIAVAAVWFVFTLGLGKLSATVNHLLVSENMSHMANVAIGEKTAAVDMFTVPLLVNWVALAVFILVRSGAVKLARTLSGGVSLLSLAASVASCIFTGKLLGAISQNMPNVIEAATPLTRVALLLDFLGVVTVLFFWYIYGEGRIKLFGGVVYSIVQPLLLTLLGAAFIFIGAALMPEGGKIGAGLVFTGFGQPLAYCLCGGGLVGILLLKKLRAARVAAKQQA